ncbi:translation initiation factor IF-2-like isoform X2 [Frankliniella occidentalis]|uniref:Translation initiation factor IF-2-like isoform X2 n=1 Tax=Frankliniella occidentalis TaxID=133901 RepID=A0A6J1S2N8_FRAOC|nr:translation initiation factor IF-2-like isoform X2 [Frankliniella occidentalis]
MEPPESSSSEGSPAHPRAARPLRRASFAPLNSLEPRIVVEESLDGDDEDADGAGAAPHPAFAVGDLAGGGCGDDSPAADENPYLLSPWRDTRKSSLPTPACSSGITASQVRRLSERGPESGPSPREQEFLATLSATPGPQPGGRRHSVVISRVPPPSLVMFGRGRRESIAAFSAAACRSEALASSTHNLQLDLMDDLLEFKAAKKVATRRCSEVVGPTQLPLINRRKSELPPRVSKEFAEEVAALALEAAKREASRDAGIVCSNSDLLHLLGSPESSAAPVAPPPAPAPAPAPAPPPATTPTRPRLAMLRENSVEAKEQPKSTVLVSLHGEQTHSSLAPAVAVVPVTATPAPAAVGVLARQERPAPDGVENDKDKAAASGERRDSERLVWDERSGSVVDAGILGSAIEGFLNKGAASDKGRKGSNSVHRATAQLSAWVTAVAVWTPRPGQQQPATSATAASAPAPPQPGASAGTPTSTPEGTPRRRGKMSCDAVCSTLKSLFIK